MVNEAMHAAWKETTPTYSMEDVPRLLAERQQKVDELTRWLDKQQRRN